MAKLLAALNLPQVGEIKLLDADHEEDVERSGALFAIALNDREYLLKAAKREDAELWVTKLNMLKSHPSGDGGKGSGGNGEREQSSMGPTSPGGVTEADLDAQTSGGQSDPNSWAKMARLRLCC